MSQSLLKISGGYVYDPAHGVDGQVKDLWIRDGKITEPPSTPAEKPTRTLNASGLIVMPGGIDMHCHIAGPKVNTARKMRPEEKRRDHEPNRGCDPAFAMCRRQCEPLRFDLHLHRLLRLWLSRFRL